jgi:hypothetical protein
MSEKVRRTEIQIEDLIDQIFRLQVIGATPKQIQKQLNLPERTYFEYNSRLQERIVGAETAKRTEEILVQKELCHERLVKSMRGLEHIATTDGISPRTKMDAWYKFAEVSMAEFKLQGETTNWLLEYNRLRLEEPIRLASTIDDPSEQTE